MGQASSTIADGGFTAAEGHAVVFCFSEPVGRLPVAVVVNPTAVQLWKQRRKGDEHTRSYL